MLNDVGIAFKDAGFQFPEEDASFIATPRTLTRPAVLCPSSRDARTRIKDTKRMLGV